MNASQNDLASRLRFGSGEDRELDCDIDVHFYPGEIGWKQQNWTMESTPYVRRPSKNHLSGFVNEHVPHYTSDLNAVFALVEREGFKWSRIEGARKDDSYLAVIEISDMDQVFEIGESRCRALLLALLAAKDNHHG